MTPIPLYNRKTGTIEAETVFEPGLMEFLYGSWPGFWLTELLLKRRWATELYARLQHSSRSKSKINRFIEKFGVDVTELERPVGSFNSFNEFFIRKLKPEARPIDRHPDHLISIADCRLSVYPIRQGEVYPVKAKSFTIAQLIGDEKLAANYTGGWLLIFRLAPVDYHRFCYVDDGEQSPVVAINGFYRSVHPLSLGKMKAVFTENRREYCILRTANFGEVIHIDVGATGVGRIIQHHPQGARVKRGEEKGYFEFGGSTVILLTRPGVARIDDDIAEHSASGIETIVRYGEKIGARV